MNLIVDGGFTEGILWRSPDLAREIVLGSFSDPFPIFPATWGDHFRIVFGLFSARFRIVFGSFSDRFRIAFGSGSPKHMKRISDYPCKDPKRILPESQTTRRTIPKRSQKDPQPTRAGIQTGSQQDPKPHVHGSPHDPKPHVHGSQTIPNRTRARIPKGSYLFFLFGRGIQGTSVFAGKC